MNIVLIARRAADEVAPQNAEAGVSHHGSHR